MNIDAITIYLWQLADQLISTSTTFAFFSFFTTAVLSGFVIYNAHMANGGWESEKANYPSLNKAMDVTALNAASSARAGHFKRYAAISFLTFCLFSIFANFIPSSSTIAMMVIIPKVAESKVIQEDVPELYNAAIEALKSKLKETSK